jgi:glycosyltransferase involved in cell wall biosynthesis
MGSESDMKKISVIIPTYNSESTLVRCVDSVLRQGYNELEVLIIDDGSTDDSLSIISHYDRSIVNVFSQKNKGACAARNLGIKKSSGYYIKFLDSDDFLEDGALITQVEIANGLDSNSIPYGYRKVLNGHESKVAKKTINSENQFVELINNNITITLPLHRREVLISMGKFDEQLKFRQEFDLHLRLANSGFKFFYHNDCIFTQYIHQSEHRISAREMVIKNELDNLNLIRSKFITDNSTDAEKAWSNKYWNLGRNFVQEKMYTDAKLLFGLSKDISPKGYMELQPLVYRVMYFIFGAFFAEKLIYTIRKYILKSI